MDQFTVLHWNKMVHFRDILSLSFRLMVVLAILAALLPAPELAQAVGGAYSIRFTAADPRLNQGPYPPTYPRYTPDGLACPSPLGGRANNPLKDAVYASPISPFAVDSVTSMAPGDISLGQIVPFEVLVTVSGNTSPENGIIRFKTGWSTHTTSNDNFGYDDTYMVYCAFVDYGDSINVDPGNDAMVDSYTSVLAGEDIVGDFQISGLDDGDQVVVEIWVVLDSLLPGKVGGNVPSEMIEAATFATPPDTINVGAQTLPLNHVVDFYRAEADLAITKIDVPNTPLAPATIFDYVIDVTNTSLDTTSNGVVVTDTLDIFVELLSIEVADPGGFGRFCVDPLAPNGGEVFCDLKSITPQQTIPITLTVKINSDAPRASVIETGECIYGDHNIYDLCNKVELDTTITADDNILNDEDTEPKDVLLTADLGIVVQCPTDPITTATAKFLISAVNYGPDPASGVVITDTLPDRTEFISYSSNLPASQSLDGRKVIYKLDDDLDALQNWVIEMTLDVSSIISNTTVVITNTAVITALTPEPIYANNTNYATCSATPVTLNYFLAERQGDTVFIKWQTAVEAGTVGYNLLVKTSTGNIRVNPKVIESPTLYSSEPRTYEYKANVKDGDKFFLEEIDAAGRVRRYGPFSSGKANGRLSNPKLTDWPSFLTEHEVKAARRVEASRTNAPANKNTSPLFGFRLFLPNITNNYYSQPWKPVVFPPIELKIDQDGLYRITFEDLFTKGFPLAGVKLEAIALRNKGTSIPIYIHSKGPFSPGDYIEFYGQAIQSLYTRENVYTLEYNPRQAARMSFVSAEPGIGPVGNSYREFTKIENNNVYGIGAPAIDPWFDQEIRVGAIPGEATYLIQANHLVPGLSRLRIGLWGMTDIPKEVDHHLVFSINGTQVGESTFDGIVYQEIQLDLPTGLLQEGGNWLTITLPIQNNRSAGQVSAIAVDWIGLEYERSYFYQAGGINFELNYANLQVEGLPSEEVMVYKLGNSLERLTNFVVEPGIEGYRILFSGVKTPGRYFVFATDSIRTPRSIGAARINQDLLDSPAEMLIISHPDFISELAPLVASRKQEGLTVRLVDVEDVYQSYSYGIFSPDAIRSYIKEAFETIGTRYVLLVGGDSYDYLGFDRVETMSFIPSLYSSTHLFVRHSPMDALYGDINNDGLPEVAVGRFPVRSSEETQFLVAKTLTYQSKDYARQGVFTADVADGTLSFARQSDALASLAPDTWTIEKIYLGEPNDVESARQKLINTINAGVAVVNYFGHSSDLELSSLDLFSTVEASQLVNFSRPTGFNLWGCWNTLTNIPGHDSLAHAILVAGEQGAAFIFGSNTLTGEDTHESFSALVIPEMMTPGIRIGEAIIQARLWLALYRPELSDSANSYNLLGDPTLIIDP